MNNRPLHEHLSWEDLAIFQSVKPITEYNQPKNEEPITWHEDWSKDSEE